MNRKPINTRAISFKKQREICLGCSMVTCDSTSPGCPIRKEVNRLLRIQYWKNPEKSRASRRKKNMTDEQYEKKKQYMKQYYEENKDVILMKQKHRKEQNIERMGL